MFLGVYMYLLVLPSYRSILFCKHWL